MSAVLTMSTWLEPLLLNAPAMTQPAWLQAYREQQLENFLARGLPTRKDEWWKYTNVAYLEKTHFSFPVIDTAKIQLEKKLDSAILLVFKNGHFSLEMSDIHLLPQDVILTSLSVALSSHEKLIKPYLLQELNEKKHPFTYLNSALMSDGVFLSVPEGCVVPYPIHLLFINTQQNDFVSCPRNIIIAQKNSQVKIIEEHAAYQASDYFTNAVTQLDVHANAQLDYYKLQNEHSSATHIANVKIQQQQASIVNTFFIDCGSRLAREDLTIYFHERHAECHMKGLYLLERDDQHIDNHIYVDHVASHCTSTMKYKGVLDKKSQAVFNGKVYAHAGAKQTNAQQANHNLLLSPDAQVNTKPELEIYEEDVKCIHGATVGQLNEDALFYLRARGIEKEAALTILTHAFIEEISHSIADPIIRNYIQQQVRNYASL